MGSISDYVDGYNGQATPELAFRYFADGYATLPAHEVEVVELSATSVDFVVRSDGLPQLIAHARTVGTGWVVGGYDACRSFEEAAGKKPNG